MMLYDLTGKVFIADQKFFTIMNHFFTDEINVDDAVEYLEPLKNKENINGFVELLETINSQIEFDTGLIQDLKRRIERHTEFKQEVANMIKEMVHQHGEPKPSNPDFRFMMIDSPVANKVWTQYDPPHVEVVNERDIDSDFLIPQPEQIDAKSILATHRMMTNIFEQAKDQEKRALAKLVENDEMTQEEMDECLAEWEEEHEPKIDGVEVVQNVGVRYK